MQDNPAANQTGRFMATRAQQPSRNHSIEHAQSHDPGGSTAPAAFNRVNDNEGKVSSAAGTVHVEINSINGSQGSCVIPGVEHVFFETELDKMEHQTQDGQIVVLAVDGSIPSEIAFQVYVDHVNRPGYILHVVHHSNYWGDYELDGEGPSPKNCQDMLAKEDIHVKEVEEKYRRWMADNNITGEFIVLHGKDTWHDVIQYQEKVKGIMIVIGTRGQNTLRRTFMGSVSDSVVHHASCPVLVCCHPKN